MIIPCFRCGKEINTPGISNADYIIAEDTRGMELTQMLIALSHNGETLAKQAQGLEIDDEEYSHVEVSSAETAKLEFGKSLVRVEAKMEERYIQKTGIICPGCYRPTDLVIWGVHKEVTNEMAT